MADKSKIEWTDATWPIVQGCDPLSQGCVHCYAVPLLWRMMHHPDPKISGPLQGVVEKHVNAAGEEILRFTGKIALRHDRLDWPLKWKKPRTIFVPSHGDLFHKDVPDEFIDKTFETMGACDDQGLGHQFQVLTKRSARQRDYMQSPRAYKAWNSRRIATEAWPPRNIWFGVSVEDQANADERIPHLLCTPAAIRFVSAEPLLGPIDLRNLIQVWHESHFDVPHRDGVVNGRKLLPGSKLDWVIVGGESGPDARPMHPDWARSLRDQCEAAGVAFFFKQWGNWSPIAAEENEDGEIDAAHPMPGCCSDSKAHEGGQECLFWQGDKLVHWPLIETKTAIGARNVGKKAAGRLLDSKHHNDMPGRVG